MPGFRARDLVPHREFVIDTAMSAADVSSVLASNMARREGWFTPVETTFEGGPVGVGRFEFERVISYKNSWKPVVEASVEPSRDGALVRVRMRLRYAVAVFTYLWVGCAALVGIGGLVLAIGARSPEALVGVVFPLFGIALSTGCFGFEARRAELLLRAMLELEPPPVERYR